MWQSTMLVLGLAVLLASNIWLLRELDKLRHRLEQLQVETSTLDNRICALMFDVEAAHRRLASLEGAVVKAGAKAADGEAGAISGARR